MKYYIVALFDEETYQVISPIQKNMSKKFKANRNSPLPFIPLVALENINLDKLDPLVQKVISPYKSFRVDGNDLVYLFEPLKTINLQIDNKGYIKRISRLLVDTLTLNGFNAKSFDNSFVSIASVNYLGKDYKKQDVKLNFPDIYDSNDNVKLRIKSIEIWKLPLTKKTTPLKTYILKEF